jgi:MarR family 2-MHQ and catechol resistance regulon transcriptional repressor
LKVNRKAKMPTHAEAGESTTRALNAYINLARASDSLFGRMSAQIEQEGLTLGQFGVLEALLHLGPMCQRELGQKLLRSGGNITLVVDNLERDGWVRRERLEKDHRMVRVLLTPEGRDLIERVFPKHARAIRKEMGALTAAEQEDLRRLCRKLGKGAEASGDEPKEKSNDSNSTKRRARPR